MLLHRRILLVLVIVAVGGSLSWTAGYGLHLRSESYRRETADDLTAYFELPCDVGAIRGHTFSSRSFEDVTLWLPNRRDRVFHCRQAVWHEIETKTGETRELDLFDGMLVLGSDQWVREDYRQLLRSGLGHDFADLKLTRVGLNDFMIQFSRGEFLLRCRDTSGTIDLSQPGDGIARLQTYDLNDHRIEQGVQIYARFAPSAGVRIREWVLTLPTVPLNVLGLDPLLGAPLDHGEFTGSVQFVDNDGAPEFWFSGELRDAQLAELTRKAPLGPFEGRFSLDVDGARLVGDTVTHLRGRGRIHDLRLSAFAPLLARDSLSGVASFDFDVVDLALSRIERLRFAGGVRDLVLEQWLGPLGHGEATGRMTLRVNNVDIVADDIKSADIEVSVIPPSDRPGTISRELLLSAAERFLDFSWPAALPRGLLPQNVEYAEFGMRLLIRDNRLRILGTHGTDGKTILTIKVGNLAFGVVREQPGSIDLGPALRRLLQRARSYRPDQVRDWWRSQSSALR